LEQKRIWSGQRGSNS